VGIGQRPEVVEFLLKRHRNNGSVSLS
jgi:hypothetical protein